MNKETNLEHYKEDLKHIINCYRGYSAAINDMIRKKLDKNFNYTGVTYNGYFTDYILDWMAQPYREQILNGEEAEYLLQVIDPFRDMVESIYKGNRYKDDHIIRIDLKSDKSEFYPKSISFPLIEGKLMYKGMEVNKHYTLEELRL